MQPTEKQQAEQIERQRRESLNWLSRLLARSAAPSCFEVALRAAPSFEAAVTLARRRYLREAKQAHDPAFWLAQADDAGRVLAQWRRLQNSAMCRERLSAWLHKEGLCPYLAAWQEQTGEAFARELGF